MSFINRIIAVIILCIFVFGISTFAADDTYKAEEIINFQNDLNLLQILGVLDRETEKDITSTVTRAEFSKIILSLLGYSDLSPAGIKDFIFSDVSEKTPYVQYIVTAVSLNLMDGYSDNTFKPDSYIKFEEVIDVFISACGYDIMVQGYKDKAYGSMVTAAGMGLLSGVDVYIGYPVTYGALLRIINNSFGISFIMKTGVNGDGSDRFEIVKGKNLFTESLNVRRGTGVVKGTQYTDILVPKSLPEGRINIDGEIYAATESYVDLIGYYVEFYINTKNDDNQIIYLNKIEKHNDVQTIYSKDIISYKNRKYKYYEGNSIREVNLPNYCYIIYNNRAIPMPKDEQMKIKSGYVTLIDNNLDGEYDVACVTSYEQYVVYMVDGKEQVIYCNYDSSKQLKLDTENGYVTIKDTNGRMLDISDIKQWDVLTVKQSDDGEITEITVCSDLVRGTIEEIIYDEFNVVKQIKISGKKYAVSELSFYGTAKVGKAGLFLLNNYGEIAAIRNIVGSLTQTGYLIDAAQAKGLDEFLYLKIFDSSNEVLYLQTASKVLVDGKDAKKASDVLDVFKNGTDSIIPQIIQYTQNESGEVSTINTAFISDKESEEDFRVLMPAASLYYRSAQMTFDGKINISSATQVFRVPADVTGAEDDDYKMVSSGYFDDNIPYTIEAYSTGSNTLSADIILLKEDASSVRNRYGIIKSVSEILDDSKALIKKLLIHDYNTVITAFLYDDYDTLGLNNGEVYDAGDFIKYSMNQNNRIFSMTLIFDESERLMKITNPSGTAYVTNNRVAYGAVYKKEGNVFALTTDDPANPISTENYLLTQFKVFSYDKSARKPAVESISFENLIDYKHDMQHYSRVLVYTYYNEGRMIIEYK